MKILNENKNNILLEIFFIIYKVNQFKYNNT